MSYYATVLDVMIASPGDVSKEREIVRTEIHDWNAIHAKDRQVVLMPVGWETNSTPETGDRPQAIINAQLLKNADLLVAVFWTRLGSPTGVAPSGTVEEIEEHLKAGKQAMIYFSAAPAHVDSVDPEQYKALKEFKQSLGNRGLYFSYEKLSEFRDHFRRHLAQIIIAKFQTNGGPESETVVATPSALPSLSAAASDLLQEASRDKQGAILSFNTFSGRSVQTNSKNFVETGNPRSEATWKGVVEELILLGLIEDRGGKGEVFFVTDQGFRVVDRLDGAKEFVIPRQTVRVVQGKKESHWSKGSNYRQEPLMMVRFFGSITEVSGNNIKIVHGELVKVPGSTGDVSICNGHNGIRPQVLNGYEMANVIVDFTFPFIEGLKVGESWNSSVVLVDQFGNRHEVPDCTFHSLLDQEMHLKQASENA